MVERLAVNEDVVGPIPTSGASERSAWTTPTYLAIMPIRDNHGQTIDAYRKNFDKYVERSPQDIGEDFKVWVDAFVAELPRSGKIFEVGSAFGRDARYFADKGFSVLCTDIVPQALESLSRKGFATAYYDFRDEPKKEWVGEFDGFFANVVFVHASQPVFEQALWNVLKILKPGGVCAFSMKAGQGEIVSLEKLDAPRFFKYYSLAELKGILDAYPLEIVSIETMGEGRWLDVIFRKRRVSA